MEKICVVSVTTKQQLAACLAIRQQVFITEQQIAPELELDQHDLLTDKLTKHFLLLVNDLPVGTLRVMNTEKFCKIGRVAILKAYRGQGLGTELMTKIMLDIKEQNLFDIQHKYFYLEAQIDVIPFYKNLNFLTIGEEFWVAGKLHQKMIKQEL